MGPWVFFYELEALGRESRQIGSMSLQALGSGSPEQEKNHYGSTLPGQVALRKTVKSLIPPRSQINTSTLLTTSLQANCP